MNVEELLKQLQDLGEKINSLKMYVQGGESDVKPQDTPVEVPKAEVFSDEPDAIDLDKEEPKKPEENKPQDISVLSFSQQLPFTIGEGLEQDELRVSGVRYEGDVVCFTLNDIQYRYPLSEGSLIRIVVENDGGQRPLLVKVVEKTENSEALLAFKMTPKEASEK